MTFFDKRLALTRLARTATLCAATSFALLTLAACSVDVDPVSVKIDGEGPPSTGGGSAHAPTSDDFVSAYNEIGRRADSQLVSDVLDFSEDPPVRGQTTCDGTVCTAVAPGHFWDFEIGEIDASALEGVVFGAVSERRGVSLISLSRPSYVHSSGTAGTVNALHAIFGGWLDHSYFGVEAQIHPTTNRLLEDAFGSSIGQASGTNPLSGGATWNGVMVGRDVSASATRGHAIQGDAKLVIAAFANPKLGVAFTNIRDVDAGQRRTDMRWDDVPLTNGGFATGGDGNSIAGKFYGPDHEEVGGIFERDQAIGAFGASR